MMKKDTYFSIHPGGIAIPATCAVISVCFFVLIYFDRNLGKKEMFALSDWILTITSISLTAWFLFNAIWDIQWVRFEKDRLVLANPFSRNLKSIEYSDMDVFLCPLVTMNADSPSRIKSMKVQLICIYSKKYHPRRYKYGGCNFFGKHRMHIYFNRDVFKRLVELSEEHSKGGTASLF